MSPTPYTLAVSIITPRLREALQQGWIIDQISLYKQTIRAHIRIEAPDHQLAAISEGLQPLGRRLQASGVSVVSSELGPQQLSAIVSYTPGVPIPDWYPGWAKVL